MAKGAGVLGRYEQSRPARVVELLSRMAGSALYGRNQALTQQRREGVPMYDKTPAAPPETLEEACDRIASLERLIGASPAWLARSRTWAAAIDMDLGSLRTQVDGLLRLSDETMDSARKWRTEQHHRTNAVEVRMGVLAEQVSAVIDGLGDLTAHIGSLDASAEEYEERWLEFLVMVGAFKEILSAFDVDPRSSRTDE